MFTVSPFFGCIKCGEFFQPKSVRYAIVLRINVTEFEECKNTYGKRGATLTDLKQMCAGGEDGRDSCVGDSGSALMREFIHGPEDTIPRYKLIGVVSFGPRHCGTENISGVYTRVRAYLDWILDNIEP